MPRPTNYDGQLEAMVEQFETLAENLEAMYGPPSVTPLLPAVTNMDGLLEAIADALETAQAQFEELYPPAG